MSWPPSLPMSTRHPLRRHWQQRWSADLLCDACQLL